VNSINEAFQAIEHGELDQRAAGADRSDELGELAAHTNRMLARIETLVKAHRGISDNVAHELRTPLMHLDNRLLHLVETLPGAEAATMLTAAREDIRSVLRMLDSLLDISASEAQRGDNRGLETVNLSDVVRDLVELYEESANDRGLGLTVAIEGEVAMLGDQMLLSRMVSNLLDNAFKAVPDGGGEIRVSLRQGPRLEVADNGPGIPADMRERVFERFRRLPSTNGKGHGLGLPLARAIAERHGLAIRIEDANPGARFIIDPEHVQ
jgi:signal transduction histidine kinase